MQHFLELWTSFFWISLILIIIGGNNLLNITIIAELIWGIIYIITVLIGLNYNSLILVSFGFYTLVFAAMEFVLGIFLVVTLKNLNINLFLYKNENNSQKKELLYRFKKFNTNFFFF